MPKRKIEEIDEVALSTKRCRTAVRLELLDNSDELLLRVLSFLLPSELGVTAGVCQRLKCLSNDPELWKEKYYERWILPRLLRIRRPISRSPNQDMPRYSSKSANWLDHRHLLFPDRTPVDWKKQYQTRQNWYDGTCRVKVMRVEQPPAAPTIIKIHKRFIFTADEAQGLCAWSTMAQVEPIAQQRFEGEGGDGGRPSQLIPTSMAIDVDSAPNVTRIAVGFKCGSFRCYDFSESQGFQSYCELACFRGGLAVTAIAMSSPYIFTMFEGQRLRLDLVRNNGGSTRSGSFGIQPLASLMCNHRYHPHSLSIRRYKKEVIASVAYSFNPVNDSNWAIGMQELRFAHEEIFDDYTRSVSPDPVTGKYPCIRSFTAQRLPFAVHGRMLRRPETLSYSHPYLLAVLPDNTLMVYLVTSDSNTLTVSGGKQLWGHTSGISGAEVNDRGKAVSVSTKGGEIRIWDLETVVRTPTTTCPGRTNTPLFPNAGAGTDGWDVAKSGLHPDPSSKYDHDQLAFTQSWIAFDDEQVIVLGERKDERVLARYDFAR